MFRFHFFQLAGGAVLGIGLWMKLDEKIVNYLTVVNIDQSDPLIDHAAWLFIVVGAFVFFVGFLGCCGALRGSQSMLFLVSVSGGLWVRRLLVYWVSGSVEQWN